MIANEGAVEASEKSHAVAEHQSRAKRLYAQLALMVAATDTAVMFTAIMSARFVRYGTRQPPRSFHLILLVVSAMVLVVLVFAAFRLYSLARLSPAEEFRRIIVAVSVVISLLPVIAFWSRETYSRLWIGYTWAFALLLMLTSRRIWHWVMGRLRASGQLLFRTVIVGDNEEAAHLAESMRAPRLGFRVVGFVAGKHGSLSGDGPGPMGSLARLGGLDELDQALAKVEADCVFVASSAVSPRDMTRVTRATRGKDVQVRLSSNVSDVLSTRLMIQQVGNMTALSLKPVHLTGAQAAAKRTLDLVVGTLLLIVSLPLWAVIAVAIKVDSRGPIFYRQMRSGRYGRTFMILKFRTMVADAESRRQDLLHMNEATGPLFKLRNDPRITRVGRRLRAWSLDELPQLANVMRGEMSLVGPRPPLPEEVDSYDDWHRDRLEVPPGITGLWQVRGRSRLPFDDYVRLDLYYIENWSVAYDLYILAKTIPAVFSRKGAF
jgi:exopolysaccharide biosynthesis polyprenyl glycosylphosphotransferase